MVESVRKIWEIVKRFKSRCQSKGWRVIEREDVIKKNGKFHRILWTRKINTSTFRSIAKKVTSTIQEGTSCRPINVAYNVWICKTPLSNSLKQAIARNPKIPKRNAIYKLNTTHTKGATEKLNKTSSEVFQEFESCLIDDFQSELSPIKIQVQNEGL